MSVFELISGGVALHFPVGENGGWGYAVYKTGMDTPLYETQKPVVLILKDYAAKHVEFSGAYEKLNQEGDTVTACGSITTPMGSVFHFEDRFSPYEKENTFSFERKVRVEKAAKDDLGFGSRVTLGVLRRGWRP